MSWVDVPWGARQIIPMAKVYPQKKEHQLQAVLLEAACPAVNAQMKAFVPALLPLFGRITLTGSRWSEGF